MIDDGIRAEWIPIRFVIKRVIKNFRRKQLHPVEKICKEINCSILEIPPVFFQDKWLLLWLL